jgi:hypothetical protein
MVVQRGVAQTHVSSKTQSNNHPIYSIDNEIKSSIFYNDLSFEEEESTNVMTVEDKTK